MALTPIPKWMKQEVLDRDEWTCLACGVAVKRHPDGKNRPDTATIDHVYPDNAEHAA